MSELLLWIGRTLLFVLLQLRYPAVSQTAAGYMIGRDPSYAIYERYRYAYDTYGYLFLLGKEEMIEENAEQSAEYHAEQNRTEGGLQIKNLPTEILQGKNGSSALTLEQLADYDYLMRHFYSVHTSTTAGREIMNAARFLETDLALEKKPSVPQILIYHTHSQETYADFGPAKPDATVVSCGAYLTELLTKKGWSVIHDTTTYDMQAGTLDRNRAYTYALEGITKILEENPTIQVILDLHRDGVDEKVHLVSEVNGKQTANIMFFHGMSRTPEGEIPYLENPYLSENLAFSFQMQLAAAARFPNFTRKIYLKGLRYNLHLRPRSALIEVGAQTNTLQEAKNAMEPLAELLDIVLQES